MNNYIKKAALAWAKTTTNIQEFADTYVEAINTFDADAQERFALEYPFFGEREWLRLELVGTHKLLPQFVFKSDSFVCKLLNMKASMRIQKTLVSAANTGLLRVDRGNGPKSVSIAGLTKKEEKALSLLLDDAGSRMTQTDLRLKIKAMVIKINKQNSSRGKPMWELCNVGGRTKVHFNRACTATKFDLLKIVKAIEKAENGGKK